MRLPLRRTRQLFFEQLENRSLLAADVIQFLEATLPDSPLPAGVVTSETARAEGESDAPIPDRVTQMYWDAAQLILAGRTGELPKPTVPRSDATMPGYSMDIVQYDEQFRLATDLHVLAITPELLGNLSGLNFVYRNTYSPPNTGPIPGDALTYSRIECWLHPSDLERVLQLDYVMWVDFSTYGVVWGQVAATPATLSLVTLPDSLDGGTSSSPNSAGKSLDKINDRVIAAFAGDPSVAYPKVFYTFPGARQIQVTDKANPAADLYGVMDANGALQVQIYYEPGNVEFANVLTANGVQLGRYIDEYGIMEAWIKESELPLLSQLVPTKFVTLPAAAVISGGGGSATDDMNLQSDPICESVNYPGESFFNQPASPVHTADTIQLPGILAINSPAGPIPFAADVGAQFSNWLVTPEEKFGDVRAGEFGRVALSANDASGFLTSKTPSATTSELVVSTSAADSLSSETYETRLDILTPLSPVTLQSAHLLSVPKNP